ncbi:MAG: glycosyltransferase family 4 protein [Anaerolineales bacterium]|nr:glycosyltransferase family 4 protein [Anaerolineales bacterium]
MRVGLLIYGSLETISGGYLYDRKLVEHLRNQGDSVEIVSLPRQNYTRHLGHNFSLSLLHKLRDLPVDILIQDELNHPSLAWLNHKIRAPYPILSLVHHLRCDELRPAWQNTFYGQIERRYLDSVDGFIFNSQTTKQSVHRISRINNRPWVIANPAGDRFNPPMEAGEITKRARQPGPLRLFFLGNLIPRKGLHTLIEALAGFTEGSCLLDVVGSFEADPAYTSAIFQQVEHLGLQSMIKFHGTLGEDALAGWLRASQVLVVPSSYEGFGIVYLEGMGSGLPCIGTTQGAAREIIIPGETGYLIEPKDSERLGAILKDLAHDRPKLTALSLAARQRYQQFPGWEQSMAKVRACLLEVIGRVN